VLEDGRTDPIESRSDEAPTTDVRPRLGSDTVEFSGSDAAVWKGIDTLNAEFVPSRFGGAWLVPLSDADDVMALLEHRGYRGRGDAVPWTKLSDDFAEECARAGLSDAAFRMHVEDSRG
jgi:hypothetical protein